MTHTLLGVLATLGTIGGIALGWFLGYFIIGCHYAKEERKVEMTREEAIAKLEGAANMATPKEDSNND